MKVELYYFDGCPSYPRALDNLLEALARERLAVDVEMVRVRDAADAESKRFIGSPTIRVNGVDIEGSRTERQPYARRCRLYLDGDRSSGWPSVARIREALRRQR